MNFSKQREDILTIMRGGKLYHPTAEDVFAEIRRRNLKIGIATVYRNLNLLSQLGEIMKIQVPNEMDRYDCVVLEHYHAVCSSCGEIIDLYPPRESVYNKILQEKYGFEPKQKTLIIRGLCAKCVAKQKSEERKIETDGQKKRLKLSPKKSVEKVEKVFVKKIPIKAVAKAKPYSKSSLKRDCKRVIKARKTD